MPIDDLYLKYSVRVNNGSGCLLNPISEEYSYVLTAKHNLENPDAKKVNVAKPNGEKLEVLDAFSHEKLDFTIILVKRIEDIELSVFDEVEFEDEVVIYGFPESKKGDDFPAMKINCVVKEKPPTEHFYVIEPHRHVEHDQIVGFSGCGVFLEKNERLYLLGTLYRMDSYHNQGRLNFLPISIADDLIENNNIFPIDRSHLEKFSGLYNDICKRKIENYRINQNLAEVFREVNTDNPTDNYHKSPPFILGNFIMAFDIKGGNREYRKNRKFGEQRFRLIECYYYTYLDICKYAVLSILWDEFLSAKDRNKMSATNQEISDLLKSSKNFSKENLDTLKSLCHKILEKFGQEKEITFVKQLVPSFKMFRDGVEMFIEQTLDKGINNYELYWASEQLLYELLRKSKFINNYRIKSVHHRYYIKHRSDPIAKFKTEIFLREDSKETSDRNLEKTNYVNVHSIYICEEADTLDNVINISPFYFDLNTYDPRAVKMDLFVLNKSQFKNNERSFYYDRIYDPGDKEKSDLKIFTDKSGVKGTKNNNGSIDREMAKSTKLFEQLNTFLDHLK
ncbi:hypothetical protein [uncultured Aquimarina sp.]|uniref:hypothetical protein n=1 Tax=uncultured Aquimarina sp. TaxID=575652 RepID=UPI002606F24C|nr:hypothetical protein [uncultured Aquimarina sp.]